MAGQRHRSLGAGVPVRRHRGADRARRPGSVPAVLGPQPGGGEAGVPRLPRLCARSAGRTTRTCTSTTTPPTRRRRSGSSPCCTLSARTSWTVAARRAPGGPVPDGPEQHPDLRELLQHQEARAALHGDEPALRGREGRRRLGGCLRPLLRRARRRPGRGSRRPSSPGSPTTTNTTASPRWGCGTGCWAGPGARHRAARRGAGAASRRRGAASRARAGPGRRRGTRPMRRWTR